MAPTLGEHWKHILLMLEPNWDSYGAQVISKEAIETLNGFFVVPCNHGGIQVEFHRDGFDCEIEISPTGKISSVFLAQTNGDK